MQEVHLAAAFEFAQHGFADDAVGELADEGLDRQPLLRCRGDYREIAQAFHAHRQRARDRRRRQGQHVDFSAHGLQGFLLAHTEAVFLVDDDQAQATKLDLLADQFVGADDDVDLALGQFLQRLRRFLGGLEAGDFGDAHRPVGEAVGEGLVMLFAEQGGRAQYGHLLAAGDGAEGGTQRDFGLAEADVAADQAVHRFAGAHVVDDGSDGRGLVVGFLEAEAIGEGFVITLLEGEGMALAGGAGGIQRQQFGSGVARLLGSLALGFFPLAGTEGVQWCRFRIGAGVTGDHVQLRHRHEQLGVVGVVQFEEFLLAEAEVHAHQALVAADAVAFVHHRVADLELGQILQPVIEACLLGRLAPGAAGRAGEQFGFGNEGDAIKGEACLQRADAQRQARVASDEGAQIGGGRRLQAVLGEHRRQRFAPAGGFGDQQHAAGVAGQMVFQRTQRVFRPAVDGDIG